MQNDDDDPSPRVPVPSGGRGAAVALLALLDRALARPVPPPRALEIERAVLTSATGA